MDRSLLPPFLLLLLYIFENVWGAENAALSRFVAEPMRADRPWSVVLALDVEANLIACSGDGSGCTVAPDAARFASWLETERLPTLYPQLIAWTNGGAVDLRHKLAAVTAAGAGGGPLLDLFRAGTEREDFFPGIFPRERALALDLVRDDLCLKDARQLKQFLSLSGEVPEAEKKLLIVLDNDPAYLMYKYNTCYLQSYLRGVLVVPTRGYYGDFSLPRSRVPVKDPALELDARLSLDEVSVNLQRLAYDKTGALQPQTIERAVDLFDSPSLLHPVCSYALFEREKFYFVLVIDLAALLGNPADDFPHLLEETLTMLAAFDPHLAGPSLDGVLFSCDASLVADCGAFSSVLKAHSGAKESFLGRLATLAVVTVASADQSRDSINLLIAAQSGFPRATTLFFAVTTEGSALDGERRRGGGGDADFDSTAPAPDDSQPYFCVAPLARRDAERQRNFLALPPGRSVRAASFPHVVRRGVWDDVSSIIDRGDAADGAGTTERAELAGSLNFEEQGRSSPRSGASGGLFAADKTDDGKQSAQAPDTCATKTAVLTPDVSARTYNPFLAAGFVLKMREVLGQIRVARLQLVLDRKAVARQNTAVPRVVDMLLESTLSATLTC